MQQHLQGRGGLQIPANGRRFPAHDQVGLIQNLQAGLPAQRRQRLVQRLGGDIEGERLRRQPVGEAGEDHTHAAAHTEPSDRCEPEIVGFHCYGKHPCGIGIE
ncbi:hypothetical protein D3C80_1009290 [compost metagenome]